MFRSSQGFVASVKHLVVLCSGQSSSVNIKHPVKCVRPRHPRQTSSTLCFDVRPRILSKNPTPYDASVDPGILSRHPSVLLFWIRDPQEHQTLCCVKFDEGIPRKHQTRFNTLFHPIKPQQRSHSLLVQFTSGLFSKNQSPYGC